MSNLKEVESRGGKIIVLTDDAKTAAEIPRISSLDAAQSLALSYAHRDDDPAAIASLLYRCAGR